MEWTVPGWAPGGSGSPFLGTSWCSQAGPPLGTSTSLPRPPGFSSSDRPFCAKPRGHGQLGTADGAGPAPSLQLIQLRSALKTRHVAADSKSRPDWLVFWSLQSPRNLFLGEGGGDRD